MHLERKPGCEKGKPILSLGKYLWSLGEARFIWENIFCLFRRTHMALIGEEPGLLGKVRVVFGKLQMAPRGETHIVFRLSLAIMLSRGCVWVCGLAHPSRLALWSLALWSRGRSRNRRRRKWRCPCPKDKSKLPSHHSRPHSL